MEFKYDIIVVGAGHAGCEAASAAARMGSKTLLITMDMNKIGQMSCNPAVGGIAKGQIVREIDAMGGQMGVVTDRSAIQLDNQMNDFAYRLQMSGMSVEQYAQMMGGDMNTMRNAFKPVAEKQALTGLVIAKVAEVEAIEVSEEELEAEFAEMAKSYELEVEKVKEMVPAEEIKSNILNRKVVKFLVDNAVVKAE